MNEPIALIVEDEPSIRRFVRLALALILRPHLDDHAQGTNVETVALGLAEHVADVVGNDLLFLDQPLDALDDRLELFARGLDRVGLFPRRHRSTRARRVATVPRCTQAKPPTIVAAA